MKSKRVFSIFALAIFLGLSSVSFSMYQDGCEPAKKTEENDDSFSELFVFSFEGDDAQGPITARESDFAEQTSDPLINAFADIPDFGREESFEFPLSSGESDNSYSQEGNDGDAVRVGSDSDSNDSMPFVGAADFDDKPVFDNSNLMEIFENAGSLRFDSSNSQGSSIGNVPMSEQSELVSFQDFSEKSVADIPDFGREESFEFPLSSGESDNSYSQEGNDGDAVSDTVMKKINQQQIIDFCKKGDYRNLVQLIESAGNIDVNFVDQETKKTPLIISGINGKNKVVSYLLSKGANVSLPDKSFSEKYFIHHACEVGDIKAVYIALKHGAYIDRGDAFGNTPLHLACKNNNLTLVKFLLKNGADEFKENIAGQLPYSLATGGNVRVFLQERKKASSKEALALGIYGNGDTQDPARFYHDAEKAAANIISFVGLDIVEERENVR